MQTVRCEVGEDIAYPSSVTTFGTTMTRGYVKAGDARWNVENIRCC